MNVCKLKELLKLASEGGYRANLIRANLRGASLSGVDLSGANLIRANLWDCTGNRLEIVSVFLFDEYSVIYTSDCIQIGCERHAIDEWRKFDDRDIIKMDGKKSLEFWRKNKDFIFNIIEMKPAKPTHTQVNYEH